MFTDDNNHVDLYIFIFITPILLLVHQGQKKPITKMVDLEEREPNDRTTIDIQRIMLAMIFTTAINCISLSSSLHTLDAWSCLDIVLLSTVISRYPVFDNPVLLTIPHKK